MCLAPRFVVLFLALVAGMASAQELEIFGSFELPDSADLTGSAACAACHEAYAEKQEAHHMALTASAVTPQSRDLWFSSEKRSEGVEWPSEAGAAPKYLPSQHGVDYQSGQAQPVPVAAVLGSGVHGVTPISAEPGRRIRELRLSYSKQRGGWFMTPGSDNGGGNALGDVKSREESRECLGCHATAASWSDDVLNPAATRFGVQCERCHGPGSAHIDAVTAGSVESRILNPARLRADEQVRFCAQCHRQPVDLEPLEVTLRDPKLARHAGAGLMMSACFRSSPPESTITCTDCHSPHENINAARDAYGKSCLRCHDDPAAAHRYERVTATSDCIACHMPPEARGFHGMSFTDHWIRVSGAPPPLGSTTETTDLKYLDSLYEDMLAGSTVGPERRSRLAMGRAEILYGLERPEEAFDALRDALGAAPKAQHRLKAAAMFREAGRPAEAISTLEEALRQNPDLVRAYFDLGVLQQRQGDSEPAMRNLRRALVLRPDFVEARAALGTALAQQGLLDEAIAELETAHQAAPDNLQATTALALALQSAGRFDQALVQFEELIARAPKLVPALSGAAWILATHPDPAKRRPEEAVRVAERAAVETRYRHPQVLDALAAAYAASGDFETAVGASEKAIAILDAAGATGMASEARGRLEQYRRRQAFVEKRR